MALKISVKGPKLVIKPKKTETTTKSGLTITEGTKKKEQHGQAIGEVISIGYECWKDIVDEIVYLYDKEGRMIAKKDVFREPWCKVGDTIVYKRFAGMKIPDETTKDGFVEDILIINDKDVIVVIGG